MVRRRRCDGQSPSGGLIEASDGNFYGTTFDGGNAVGAQGTVFNLTPDGHLSTLFDFTSTGAVPGSGPLAGLIQGSDGNLYGTCAYGGTYGGGNIFRIIMPGPQLNAFRSGQQLVLSWRTNYTGFRLQTSAGLNPGAWSAVPNAPTVCGWPVSCNKPNLPRRAFLPIDEMNFSGRNGDRTGRQA